MGKDAAALQICQIEKEHPQVLLKVYPSLLWRNPLNYTCYLEE